MDALLNVLLVIFWGIIMFSIIVFIHEGGHFLAARAFGVRVQEFMLGLPGPSVGFTRAGTRFGVTAVPLGGYARIAGMEGGKENPNLARALAYLAGRGELYLDQVQAAGKTLGFDLEEALDILDGWGTIKHHKRKDGQHLYRMLATNGYEAGAPRPLTDPAAAIDEERTHTYRGLPWFKRVIVLVAGALFNLIFAILVLTAVLMSMGSAQATTTVETVTEGSPALTAGIAAGDKLVALDGQRFDTWEDFVTLVGAHAPGDEVAVRWLHEGTERDASIVLANNEGKAMLGVTSHPEPVAISPGEAFVTSVGFIGIVVDAIFKLFNPVTFSDTIGQSSSLVGISIEAKAAADAGFLNFIVLAAALSISIGLMNLLPIPPLDGGKIVVETIERLTRRFIPVRVVNGISTVAVCLLVLLFLVVTQQDITRYILGG